MTPLQGLGLLIILYLLLLARSAGKQGEMRQFLTSLAIVGGLFMIIAAIVAATIYLDRR